MRIVWPLSRCHEILFEISTREECCFVTTDGQCYSVTRHMAWRLLITECNSQNVLNVKKISRIARSKQIKIFWWELSRATLLQLSGHFPNYTFDKWWTGLQRVKQTHFISQMSSIIIALKICQHLHGWININIEEKCIVKLRMNGVCIQLFKDLTSCLKSFVFFLDYLAWGGHVGSVCFWQSSKASN